MMRSSVFVLFLLVSLFGTFAPSASAESESFEGVTAEPKWTVLHLQNRRLRGNQPLPAKSKVKSLSELSFTGPRPGHQFVLGHFAIDGEWGLTNGYIQKSKGKNAALQLCWADQFELEGIIEHAEFGGWFFLVGWDQGHGYSISNINFKTSGSPWFVSEMRGAKSLEDQTVEFDHFKWKGEQPFKLTVAENELKLVVGRIEVFKTPLDNYKPGMVVLGVYDTDYGPKPIRVKSLRVRSLPNVVEPD